MRGRLSFKTPRHNGRRLRGKRFHKPRRMTAPKVRSIVRKQIASSEKKFHDLPLEWNGDRGQNSTKTSSIVEIPKGDERNQREGDRCRITGIYIKMRIFRSIKMDTSTANGPLMLRWGIDEVKSNVTEIVSAFEPRGFFDTPDYLNYTRSVKLDQTVQIPYPNDGDMWGPYRTVTKFIKFKKPQWVRWAPSVGADDPVTGNLLAWYKLEGAPSSETLAAINVQANFRVYFSEV